MGMRLQRNFVKQAVYKSIEKTRMCQNDASSFRYIIIVLPFFIEYDLCFSYVHAFWGYNVL